MIKQYIIPQTDNTYLRLWQKINFGKEILPEGFFDTKTIENCSHCYRFNVFQLNKDTRLFYIGRTLYFVDTADLFYNYLDTGRAVEFKTAYSSYSQNEPQEATIYIFNDLIITDEDIEYFNDFRDKESLKLKQLAKTDTEEIYIVYAEDLQKIKAEIQALKKERELERQHEREQEIENKQKTKKLLDELKNYTELTVIEDDNAIVSANYFIDKNAGIKIEFTDNIVKIFDKDYIFKTYDIEINDFIQLGYVNFLYSLENLYEISLYKSSLEDKLSKFNKKLLNFKIYSYNVETKEEVFLKEIEIKNIYKEQKIRFEVNGVKMPKQKMSKLFHFLRRNTEPSVIKERLINFEKYAEQIKIYSGIQLNLLEGKTIDISLNGIKIPIHFNLIAEDKENWKISLENFSVRKTYKEIRESFYHVYGGGLEAISRICESLNADSKLEEIIVNNIKFYVEKRRQAEERAEKLFTEFLDKNKGKIFKKDNGYIVKGKLKNYLVKMKDKENAGVWTYPANEYICINEKTRAGQYLCKFDKLLQFCIAMLNDGNLKEEIYTLS